MSIGDLTFDFPPTLRLTWSIPDFFRVATESGWSLQSPDFPFADGRYGLRLFQTRDYDDIYIELLSLTDPDPGRALLYEVRIKLGTGEDDMDRDIEDNRVEFYFDRDEVEEERNLYVPDGTLTLLCSVRPREQSVGGTPNSGRDRTRVIPPHRMTIGELSSETTPSLYVTWTIPRFFRLARESTRTLESPEFPFSGRRHRLRLIPSEDSVEIHLVNWSDSDPGRYASYELGLKSTTGEEIHIHREGTSTSRYFSISRRDLDPKESECFPDGHLTVFCCVGSSEPSSAGRTDEDGFPGRLPSSAMSIGDLTFDFPPTLSLTWSIPDFHRLATESGFSVQSPDFPIADGRYGLRLFHNVDLDGDWIDIELLSLTDPDPGRALLYEVRIKSGTGQEDMRRFIEDNRVEFYFVRDELADESDRHVRDGTLTLLCSLRPRKQSVGGTPNSGGERTRVIPRHTMTIGELSSETTPSLYVTWTIPRFFRLARESTRTLESPEFHFSSRRHHLRLISSGDWVDIHLVNLCDSDSGRYASYELGLKPTTGEEIRIDRVGTSTTRYFYIDRRDLDPKKSECFPDGHLTVFCCVGSSEPSSAERTDEEGFPGVEKLQSDYKRLLLQGVESDASLVVCGKEFRAHRNVLRVRSPVFEAMFSHETAEKDSGRVVIDDLNPDRFQDFMEYLYTGRVESFCDENAFGLYAAADKYDVPTLKSECVEYMRRSLSVDNFCDVLTLALRHHEKDLLAQAVEFFKKNVAGIILTVKWQQFMSENSTRANELLIKLHVPGKEAENVLLP